jgi:two-component system nitrate/nitrite response regulator NarL
MDVHMPEMDGVQAVRTLRQLKFSGRILMLTVSENEQDLKEALQAGADGYLLKNLEPEDLHRAIRQAGRGMGVLSPEVTRTVLDAFRSGPESAGLESLSPRELEVLGEIAKGSTTVSIAKSLSITEPTVKTHVKNIFRKLGAANRAEAIHIASQAGLLSPRRNHSKG